MRKLWSVKIVLYLMTVTAMIGLDAKLYTDSTSSKAMRENNKAPRPDAPQPGSPGFDLFTPCNLEPCCEDDELDEAILSIVEEIESKLDASVDCIECNQFTLFCQLCDLKQRVRCIHAQICGCVMPTLVEIGELEETILSKVDNIETTVDNIESIVEGLLGGVCSCVSSIESKLEAPILSQLDNIESVVDSLLGSICSCVSAIDIRVNAPVLSALDQIENCLDCLSVAVLINNADTQCLLNDIDSKVSLLAGELCSCVSNLDTQLDAIESTVDLLAGQVCSCVSTAETNIESFVSSLIEDVEKLICEVSNEIECNQLDIICAIGKICKCVEESEEEIEEGLTSIENIVIDIDNKVTTLADQLCSCVSSIDITLDASIESKLDIIESTVSLFDEQLCACVSSVGDEIEEMLCHKTNQILCNQLDIICKIGAVCRCVEEAESEIESTANDIDSKIGKLGDAVDCCSLISQLSNCEQISMENQLSIIQWLKLIYSQVSKL